MKWIEADFKGSKVRVPAVKAQGKLWFHWQGVTYSADLNSGTRRAGADKNKAHPGVIAAPMPGKITRVSVKAGDTVTKGHALVVMEAMKMEYTLEADRDGRVTEVNVQPGVQVGQGEVLVRVVEA
jgi:acetyl/propionyl-CoA carboxylase alpha subunit